MFQSLDACNAVFWDTKCDDNHVDSTPMNDDASKFYDYVEDANEVMYLGCKFTKLSVTV